MPGTCQCEQKFPFCASSEPRGFPGGQAEAAEVAQEHPQGCLLALQWGRGWNRGSVSSEPQAGLRDTSESCVVTGSKAQLWARLSGDRDG